MLLFVFVFLFFILRSGAHKKEVTPLTPTLKRNISDTGNSNNSNNKEIATVKAKVIATSGKLTSP